MSYSRTRKLTSTLSGPTVEELRSLLAGIDGHQRVRISYDRGYNQFDPGGISFTVSEDQDVKRPSGDWGGNRETTR